jgi:predicted nucleic acid-binding protein
MGLTLLDSSAVIAFLDLSDTLRPSAGGAIDDALDRGDNLAMSVVTWNETLLGSHLGHVPEPVLREFVVDFNVRLLSVEVQTAERAAELQYAYRQTRTRAPWPRLRTPDALILATGDLRQDVEHVVAGDEQWTKVPGVEAEIVLLRAA